MCRVPVVATAVGGIPEIVMHRSTGLLVQPRDPGTTETRLCGSSRPPRSGRASSLLEPAQPRALNETGPLKESDQEVRQG